METLKDRALLVDKILFSEEKCYFAYYKKNCIFNENDKSSSDYQRRMREFHLETISILISIQDFFSAIGHSNYYLPT